MIFIIDLLGLTTITEGDGSPLTSSSLINPYLFTDRRYDEETGLYYYRARYYSPDLGRFISADPIGYMGGLNLYTYCGNNPLNWLDPWGLEKEDFENLKDQFKDGIRSYVEKNPGRHISCDEWQNAIMNEMNLNSQHFTLEPIYGGWFFGPMLGGSGHNFVGVYNGGSDLVSIFDPWTPFTTMGFSDKWGIHIRSTGLIWIHYPPFLKKQEPDIDPGELDYMDAFDKPWFGHHF